MRKIYYIEPIVMIATLIRWLILSTITGAIVGTGASFFLHGLYFSTNKTVHIPLWTQMLLLPIGGILNGLILYYGYHNASYLKPGISLEKEKIHVSYGLLRKIKRWQHQQKHWHDHLKWPTRRE